jgi:carboxyl-terminal processing protease
MKTYLLKTFLSSLLLITILTSCKKDRNVSIIDTQGATRTQLTLDSIFLYAKETYLWYDALPGYEQFNPRKYTESSTELTNLQKELFDITQFKINPSTGLPYEYSSSGSPKYSFITTDATNPTQKKSAVTLEGNGDDFGFALAIANNNDIRIKYVNPGSPADIKGLERGYRLVKINGSSVSTSSQSDINLINNAFDLQTMTLIMQKPDGTQISVSLTKTSYTSNPVFKKAIFNVGKQVGYIAYARFSSLQNSQQALDQAFAEFSAAGVTDIIVDLRYNGGGYVETAQYLANLIIPTSVSGSLMYIEYYNQLMQAGKAPILSKQIIVDANNKPVLFNGRTATYADVDYSVKANTYNFSKKGPLNTVKNVYFIITGNTASASELVINNLKPYLNVKLIGSKSYGKPVGFFGLRIDKYTVYLSQFQSKNSSGQGEYFDGFQPDFSATDDVTRNFGDPNEISLAKALALIKDGTTLSANSVMVLKGDVAKSASTVEVKNIGLDEEFKGMVEDRVRLKR